MRRYQQQITRQCSYMFEVWWTIQQPLYYGFIAEFADETIFKICEHLAKLQARSD